MNHYRHCEEQSDVAVHAGEPLRQPEGMDRRAALAMTRKQARDDEEGGSWKATKCLKKQQVHGKECNDVAIHGPGLPGLPRCARNDEFIKVFIVVQASVPCTHYRHVRQRTDVDSTRQQNQARRIANSVVAAIPSADARCTALLKDKLMLRGMNDLENYTIGATDGDIGQVEDFYFDDHAWVIRYFVVDTGSWLASRKVLISPIAIHDPNWALRMLPVSITKEQVRNSPDIDTDKPVSRQHEMQYYGYYGYPYYWGDTGIWGGGMYPYLMYPGYADFGSGRIEREKANAEYAKAEQARHRDDDPNLRSCKAVIGYHIHATDGDIGHVEGLLIDEETWAIRYIVVNTSNWWVGHKVLIAPQWIKDMSWSDQSVSVDLTRASIKGAPPYDSTAELNRELESGLYAHYGRLGYWAAKPISDSSI